jgi:hypothetical protein
MPTSSVVRSASARSRSTSASAEARRCCRMPESGNCCSIVTLTLAPPSMNGRWSSEGEIIGSASDETMSGRASPARTRARAAWISSLRSPAIRTTSLRASGAGSAWPVWAAVGETEPATHRAMTRASRGPTDGFMSDLNSALLLHNSDEAGALGRHAPPGRSARRGYEMGRCPHDVPARAWFVTRGSSSVGSIGQRGPRSGAQF